MERRHGHDRNFYFYSAAGALLTLAGKVGWLGRLPGDIRIRRDGFSFYFPLATSLLLSILLTLLLNLFLRRR